MPAIRENDPGSETLSRAYRWFSLGVASWFGSFGIQQVIFSWLVVGELGASSEWVGIAQTCNMLPGLLLLLAGGATADRFDPRGLLVGLHLLAAIPVAGLGIATHAGWLSLPLLIGFGLVIGTLSAFMMPARDTLLSRVAGRDMMRAVSGLTAVQFGAQALGAMTAGSARWVGSAAILGLQSCVLLVGCLGNHRVPALEPRPKRAAGRSTWSEIHEGLVMVWHTPRLRTPVSLVLAVGILFVGPFMVIFPLLVRDAYQGGVDSLSLVLMMFPIGTIAGSLVIRRRGLRRKGRALVLALYAGASCLSAIGSDVPFPVMVLLTFGWGLAGSVFINCSRTLYQEAAPPDQRGRVMAVYQLGFTGGAPLGALSSGFVSNLLGPHLTLMGYAALMIVMVTLVALASDVLEMD